MRSIGPTSARSAPRTEHLLARVLRAVRADQGVPFSVRSLRLLVREGVVTAARSEGISERTFRRECRHVGTSPRALAARIRREVLRVAAAIPQEELGRILGYSNVRSLQRFFREQLGTTVRRFHRAHRQALFRVKRPPQRSLLTTGRTS